MFVSCAGGSLNLVSAMCLLEETSLDRLCVWERSVKSGVGVCRQGMLSVFVLEILYKHVFLWVCACNYGFPPLCLSLPLCFLCYLVIVTLVLSCSYCPHTAVTVCTPVSPLLDLPSSAVGPSQGLSEGLRHEAA